MRCNPPFLVSYAVRPSLSELVSGLLKKEVVPAPNSKSEEIAAPDKKQEGGHPLSTHLLSFKITIGGLGVQHIFHEDT